MWDGDKSIQKAGDNAQQLQAQTVIINNNYGIDEKRASEIYDEKFELQKSEYSSEALEEAIKRVSILESKLIPKINEIENGLAAFADPSFQFLLKDAQRAAASTERESDYDLLSELLIERVKKGSQDRHTRASVKMAVEVIENISDEALLGLTAMHIFAKAIPTSGNISVGLDVLDDIFGKIIYSNLPYGNEWLDDLEALRAVRVNHLGPLKKIKEFYSIRMSGYVDNGIKLDSEQYQRAVEMMSKVNLGSLLLIQHELNDNYVRIPVVNKSEIDNLRIIHKFNELQISQPLTPEQTKAIKQIYDLYDQNKQVKDLNIERFMAELDKRPNLKLLHNWWDNISNSVTITSIGSVLAHANAQRCDNSIPNLE